MSRDGRNPPGRGDLAIAFRVISSPEAGLSAIETWVANLILRHVNGRSGESWPTGDRMARMAGIGRRSVVRATVTLCTGHNRLFDKYRRKGDGNRVFYSPRWQTFRTLAGEISDAMKSENGATVGASDSATLGALTSSNRTSASSSMSSTSSEAGRERKKPTGRRAWEDDLAQFKVARPAASQARRRTSAAAARASARWNAELVASVDEATLGTIYDWMTPEIDAEATAAERQQLGFGVALIRKRLMEAGRADLAAALGERDGD